MPVLDVAGEPLCPVARAPYDQAVPASTLAAGRRHREGVPLAPLAADPNELPQRAPSRERDHDHLAGDREELGRSRRRPSQGCTTSMTSAARSSTDGWRSSPARDEPGGSDRAASTGTMTARMPSAAQPPSRWTDSKRLCRDGRTRSLAVCAMTAKIASTPADAIPATGEARHGERGRGRGREPGHARDRHRAVQLPQVIGQLVQPVRRDQPPQYEHPAHDAIVTRGHRDAERRE